MGVYSAARITPAGTNLTIISLEGAAAARPKLMHVILGSDATPANIATQFNVSLITAAGAAGTSITVTKIKNLSPAALITARGGTMTEPTYGGILLLIALNQQATFQWWANPGYEPEPPVGTANGVATRSIASGGTPNVDCTMLWEE